MGLILSFTIKTETFVYKKTHTHTQKECDMTKRLDAKRGHNKTGEK